jgi:hypothetical protein
LFFSDPDLDFIPIPDPGVKKAPDPGSGSATLQKRFKSRAELDFILTFLGSRDTKSLCSIGLRNALTALKIE